MLTRLLSRLCALVLFASPSLWADPKADPVRMNMDPYVHDMDSYSLTFKGGEGQKSFELVRLRWRDYSGGHWELIPNNPLTMVGHENLKDISTLVVPNYKNEFLAVTRSGALVRGGIRDVPVLYNGPVTELYISKTLIPEGVEGITTEAGQMVIRMKDQRVHRIGRDRLGHAEPSDIDAQIRRFAKVKATPVVPQSVGQDLASRKITKINPPYRDPVLPDVDPLRFHGCAEEYMQIDRWLRIKPR